MANFLFIEILYIYICLYIIFSFPFYDKGTRSYFSELVKFRSRAIAYEPHEKYKQTFFFFEKNMNKLNLLMCDELNLKSIDKKRGLKLELCNIVFFLLPN